MSLFMLCNGGAKGILTGTIRNQKTATSAVTNTVIQIMTKLGGTPWVVPEVDQLTRDCPRRKMIIGIDIIKVSRDSQINAFVASCDWTFWHSSVKYTIGDGIAEDGLEDFIKEATTLYKQEKERLPEYFVIYRGGVSESLHESLKNYEISNVRGTIKNLYEGSQLPGLLFITVVPRSSVRLMVGKSNPPALTTFEASSSEGHEFFCSHTHVQAAATAAPTRYRVVCHKRSEAVGILTNSEIETMVQLHSLMYFNWQGPVNRPGVLMCANKLGKLTKAHLLTRRTDRRDPIIHKSLNHRLFYL